MSRRGRETAAFSLFAFQDIITSVTGIMILVTLILALELLTRNLEPAQTTMETIEITVDAKEQIKALKKAIEAKLDAINSAAAIDAASVREELSNVEVLIERNEPVLSELAQGVSKAVKLQKQAEHERAQTPDEKLVELEQQLEEVQQQIEKMKKRNLVIYNPTKGDAKQPWIVEITAQGFSAARPGGKERRNFGTPDAFSGWARGKDRNSEYFVLLAKPDGVKLFDGARADLKNAGFDVGLDLLRQDQTTIGADGEVGR